MYISGILSAYIICNDQLIIADGRVIFWYIEHL